MKKSDNKKLTVSPPLNYIDSEEGYEISIEEMKYHLTQNYNSFESIKSNIRTIFSGSSLIISIIGALQITNSPVIQEWVTIHNWLITFVFIFYLGEITLCIWILSPVNVPGPIAAEWDVLYESFVKHQEKKVILKQQLSNYLDTVKLTEKALALRYKMTIWANILFPIIVSLLLILSLLPRITNP